MFEYLAITGPVQKIAGFGGACTTGGGCTTTTFYGGSGTILRYFAKSISFLIVLSLLQQYGKLSYGTESTYLPAFFQESQYPVSKICA